MNKKSKTWIITCINKNIIKEHAQKEAKIIKHAQHSWNRVKVQVQSNFLLCQENLQYGVVRLYFKQFKNYKYNQKMCL